MSSNIGKIINCRAAVLWKEGWPLTIEEITVDPPKAGEVRVRMVSTGLCASDAHIIWGENTDIKLDFEGNPVVMGHEGAGIIESVGEGVTSVEVGDKVMLMWMPQCNQCALCANPRTNLCMSDNPSTTLYHNNDTKETRLKINGKPLLSFVGVSTFSEYSVVRETQLAKLNPSVNLRNACVIGCAVGTGIGSACNIAKVQSGSTCAIWGLGAIGLSTVLGCKQSGAKNIIGIDINSDKESIAKRFGCTQFINPKTILKTIHESVEDCLQKTGGVEYAFDCIGNQDVLNAAYNSLTPWGTLTVVGMGQKGNGVNAKVANLIWGRRVLGGTFGNQKPRETNQRLVEEYISGSLPIDDLITHRISLDKINVGFDNLKAGKTIRTVIDY